MPYICSISFLGALPLRNPGTLILDVTCAPQQISFPQDTCLLNEARENLETIIDTICYEYNEPKPRTYRQNARKDYLAHAKRLDMSVDEHGMARIEKLSFDAYNESDVLIGAIESLAKRCYGLGLIRTKLDTTTRSSICL